MADRHKERARERARARVSARASARATTEVIAAPEMALFNFKSLLDDVEASANVEVDSLPA